MTSRNINGGRNAEIILRDYVVHQDRELTGYVLLEGKVSGSYSYPDVFIAMQRTHFGKRWHQTMRDLHQEKCYMPTINQFVDFLNLLRSEKPVYDHTGRKIGQEKRKALLEDILPSQRDTFAAEWLDAYFTEESGKISIKYHEIQADYTLKERSETSEGFLPTSKAVDLRHWLLFGSEHGLPIADIPEGSMNYAAPKHQSVAFFGGSQRSLLFHCDQDPDLDINPTFGVRAVKLKEQQ